MLRTYKRRIGEIKMNNYQRKTSLIGQSIKIFATVLLITAIAGGIAAIYLLSKYDVKMSESTILIEFIGYIVGTIFLFLLIYGFGDIIDRLASIDNKLTYLMQDEKK